MHWYDELKQAGLQSKNEKWYNYLAKIFQQKNPDHPFDLGFLANEIKNYDATGKLDAWLQQNGISGTETIQDPNNFVPPYSVPRPTQPIQTRPEQTAPPGPAPKTQPIWTRRKP